MPAIEVTDLVVRYGEVTAVAGVSFAAEAGSVVALLGPNGAGKTSTVETLEGYRRPTSGSVRVLGLDPVAEHRAVVERIGVMLQSGGVYPSMTARDAVSLFASYYRSPEPVDGLLERVGLVGAAAGKTPWRRLSGGEQQRVSLALALVGRPSVVFLDEPTAGIDPQARLVVRDIIAGLAAAGACVLLTTHDLDEAERIADVVTIIDHGRVVASGTPAELAVEGGGAEILFGAPPGLDVISLGTALKCVVAEVRPGEYRAAVTSTPANVAALTAWLAEKDLPLGDLRAGRQTLEDVFLRLTSEETP
jgi:ABC-2 type transport system ATP-binding protein